MCVCVYIYIYILYICVCIRTRPEFRSGPVPVEFGPVPADLAGTRPVPRFFHAGLR